MYAYTSNNPIMRIDPTGEAWWHWAAAVTVVAVLAVAVVLTAGGAAPAIMALSAAANGVASASMATTVLSFAFVGASGALGMSALMSIGPDFEDQGESAMWNTFAGGGFGALGGYLSYKEQIGNSSQAGFMNSNQRKVQRENYWKSQGNDNGRADPDHVISHIYGTYGNNKNHFIIQTGPEHRAFHSIYGYKTNGGPFHRANPYYHDWWDKIRGLLGYQ